MASKGSSRIGIHDATAFFRIRPCHGKQRELLVRSPFPKAPAFNYRTKPWCQQSGINKELDGLKLNFGLYKIDQTLY